MNSAQALFDYIADNAAISSDSPTPLYLQLQNSLRRAVLAGQLETDDAIPGERELAAGLGISRVTVRKALRGLVAEGLFEQRQGSGTYVATRLEQPLSRLTSFSEDISGRGMKPSIQWLDRSIGRAAPEEALALELSPGSEVSRLYRVRSANNKPLALEQATLPRRFLPDPTQVKDSLYRTLDQHQHRPIRALQRLRSVLLESEQSHLLCVPENSAGLYIERRAFLADGTAIEFTRSYYRGDMYDFVVELTI